MINKHDTVEALLLSGYENYSIDNIQEVIEKGLPSVVDQNVRQGLLQVLGMVWSIQDRPKTIKNKERWVQTIISPDIPRYEHARVYCNCLIGTNRTVIRGLCGFKKTEGVYHRQTLMKLNERWGENGKELVVIDEVLDAEWEDFLKTHINAFKPFDRYTVRYKSMLFERKQVIEAYNDSAVMGVMIMKSGQSIAIISLDDQDRTRFSILMRLRGDFQDV